MHLSSPRRNPLDKEGMEIAVYIIIAYQVPHTSHSKQTIITPERLTHIDTSIGTYPHGLIHMDTSIGALKKGTCPHRNGLTRMDTSIGSEIPPAFHSMMDWLTNC